MEEILAIGHLQRRLNPTNAIHGTVLAVAQTTAANASLIVANPNAGALQTISGALTVTGAVSLSSNLTIAGNLTVNGTTTTVNSTTLTVTDRLIHLNEPSAKSANDPVPLDYAGVTVYRGSASGVTRDSAALAWDEVGQKWLATLLSQDTEGTLGANRLDLGVRNFDTTGTLTVAGAGTFNGAATYNGAVSITGSNTLTVGTGATTLGGNLTVAGTFTSNGGQGINGNLTVTGNATLQGNTTVGDANQDVMYQQAVLAETDTRAQTITYNGDGSINVITEKDGATTVKTTTFSYNADGTVNTAVTAVGGKTITRTYSYDGSGNLTGTSKTVA